MKETRAIKETDKFVKGKNYFVKTLTYFYVGELVKADEEFFVLKNVSWIADTGRMSDSMILGFEKQSESEIEMYLAESFVFLNMRNIVEIVRYDHPLPTKTK